MKDVKKESKMLGELMNAMMDAMLESNAPEEMKNGIRLMKQETKVSETTQKLVRFMVDDKNDIKNKNELVLSLLLMFNSFTERLDNFMIENNLTIE